MEKRLNRTLKTSIVPAFNYKTFKISYLDEKGILLNGTVKQTSDKDFQVLIEEKQVIVNYLKGNNGEIICTLNSKRNIPWVEGICLEIRKKFS